MKRSAFLLSVVLAALPALAASIQTAKPEQTGFSSERLARIHEMVQRHIDAHDISGAVTLVARNGKVVHLEAHGLADIDAKKPMSKDSLFWIMSMTKPVVGTATLMMMEEGKLRLTDPVSRFIPEFKALKVAVIQDPPLGARPPAPGTPPLFYTVPATREITIQDLLTHVSGLNSSGPASTAEVAKIALKAGESNADYIPRLGATPLDFQPGTRWQYSPTAAFDTLVRVVEIASGEPFDRFARERIFDPLGMKDTGFRPSPEQLARIATQYRGADGTLTKVDNKLIFLNSPTYLSGGGGLESSAEDYLQFGQMLANRGELNGKRLLGTNTVELMSSVFVTRHAARPRERPRIRIERTGDHRSRRREHAHLQRKLRLGRCIRDALLGGSEREDRGAIHGAGRGPQPVNESGFRECGDAGSDRSGARSQLTRRPQISENRVELRIAVPFNHGGVPPFAAIAEFHRSWFGISFHRRH